MATKITATARPYVLTFHATGASYPVTSEEAQRLLDEQPTVSATAYKVVFPGHNTSDRHQRVSLQPATRGGGPAFIVERPKYPVHTCGTPRTELRYCPACGGMR